MIIWRCARLAALLDGFETHENLSRCVQAYTYSIQLFWRSWHRSFNEWIKRYMYFPLGGSSNKIISIWLIFSFVAIWHDFKIHLLVWGYMTILVILPDEVIRRWYN